MKLKNMVNKDISEIMKKLLYGLDYKTTYIVEFSHDMSVEVSEAEIVRDKKTNKSLYYIKRK
jgi:hypothetical protein